MARDDGDSEETALEHEEGGDFDAGFMDERAPALAFPTIGTKHSGTLISVDEVQEVDMDTHVGKTWKDGRPKMQHVFTMQMDGLPDDDEFEGVRRLFVKYKMRDAIKDAVKATKRKNLRKGGWLSIAFTGQDKPKKKGHNGTKLFTAQYSADGVPF